MPLTHTVTHSPALDGHDSAYLSVLSHANEHATAGLYRVRLSNGVLVELTATERTGSARLVYPGSRPAVMLIRSADGDVDSSAATVHIDSGRRTISGSVTSGDFCGHSRSFPTDSYYTLYFVARFDHPFAHYGTWHDSTVTNDSLSSSGGTSLGVDQTTTSPAPGKGSGAFVEFADASTINLRVGISYVSEANAEANLEAENPDGTSFEQIAARAHQAWNRALSAIEVEGGTHDQRVVFYTALYHSLLHMNLASDVNGQYRGMDLATHTIVQSQSAQYANFSGWDTYRSQVQLIALLHPEIASDMAQSLLNQADQWGCWDRWTHNTGATNVMNGDPSAAAIASIVAFGATGFDVHHAYRSLLDAATVPNEGHRCSRPRLQEWLTQHYVTAPPDARHDTSVADTLEFSSADFALSQLAQSEGDTVNAHVLLRRAQFWKNLFNPGATSTDGYLQARLPSSEWKIFDPIAREGFVEGTGAQYLWMVPFNARGLFDLLGGNSAANRRLDTFFHNSSGDWALTSGGVHPGLDNEPVLETPWLYDFSGEPWKTQLTVRAVLDRLWKPTPDGIPGNDDLGEMSSWYVWAALGLYPQLPGRAELVLASPLFPRAVIHRKAGEIRIAVHRRGVSDGLIERVELDGETWQMPWLPPSFALRGGRLFFDLGKFPNPKWGAEAADAPPSFDQR